MRRAAGRMQTVGAGMLVLAVTVAAPALSAAQQGAGDPSAEPTDPPLTTPAPPAAQGEEGSPEDGSLDAGAGAQQVAGEAAPAETTAPEPKAVPQKLAKAAAVKPVSIGDNFYTPQTISIKVGDTVTWKNDGAAPHSATADDGSFDTGVFNGGQSRSETFSTAGSIPYFCTVHGQAQSGTIKVLSSSGGSGGGSGASSSGTSEADAVASPGAAGSSSSLPATGFAAIFLAAIGMALLGSGSVLRRRDVANEAGRKRRARYFSL